MAEVMVRPDHKIANVNNGKFLTVIGERILLARDETGENIDAIEQRWDITADRDSPDKVRIMNRATNKFLAVVEDPDSNDVCLSSSNPDDLRQQWALSQYNNNYMLDNLFRSTHERKGRRLEVPGASKEERAKAGVWDPVDHAEHQQWTLSPSKTSRALRTLLTGPWRLLCPQNSNNPVYTMMLYVTVYKSDGAPLYQTWNELAGYSEFGFVPVEDGSARRFWRGFYRIQTIGGLYLTQIQNDQIKQTAQNEANRDAQLWWIEAADSSGNYMIINKDVNRPIESNSPNVPSVAVSLGNVYNFMSHSAGEGQKFKVMQAVTQKAP